MTSPLPNNSNSYFSIFQSNLTYKGTQIKTISSSEQIITETLPYIEKINKPPAIFLINNPDEINDDLFSSSPITEISKSSFDVNNSLKIFNKDTIELYFHTKNSFFSKNSNKPLIHITIDNQDFKINQKNINTLNQHIYLDDTIANVYFRFLSMYFTKKAPNKRFHIFNTFVYPQIKNKRKIKIKGKHFNIKDYDYLIFPIFDKYHWSLCIVMNLSEDSKPFIIYMDSLTSSPNARCIKDIALFLNDYVKSQYAVDYLIMDVPKQINSYDCGIYMLKYLEMFIFDYQKITEAIINNKEKENINLSLSNWFNPTEIWNKRGKIYKFLNDIQNEGIDKACEIYEKVIEDEYLESKIVGYNTNIYVIGNKSLLI